jgi:hypothetical protein
MRMRRTAGIPSHKGFWFGFAACTGLLGVLLTGVIANAAPTKLA